MTLEWCSFTALRQHMKALHFSIRKRVGEEWRLRLYIILDFIDIRGGEFLVSNLLVCAESRRTICYSSLLHWVVNIHNARQLRTQAKDQQDLKVSQPPEDIFLFCWRASCQCNSFQSWRKRGGSSVCSVCLRLIRWYLGSNVCPPPIVS